MKKIWCQKNGVVHATPIEEAKQKQWKKTLKMTRRKWKLNRSQWWSCIVGASTHELQQRGGKEE